MGSALCSGAAHFHTTAAGSWPRASSPPSPCCPRVMLGIGTVQGWTRRVSGSVVHLVVPAGCEIEREIHGGRGCVGGFGCVRTGASLQAGALGWCALAGVRTERLLNREAGSEVEMLEEEGARGHSVLLASARGTAPRACISGGCRRDLGGLRDPFIPFFVMSSAFCPQ